MRRGRQGRGSNVIARAGTTCQGARLGIIRLGIDQTGFQNKLCPRKIQPCAFTPLNPSRPVTMACVFEASGANQDDDSISLSVITNAIMVTDSVLIVRDFNLRRIEWFFEIFPFAGETTGPSNSKASPMASQNSRICPCQARVTKQQRKPLSDYVTPGLLRIEEENSIICIWPSCMQKQRNQSRAGQMG